MRLRAAVLLTSVMLAGAAPQPSPSPKASTTFAVGVWTVHASLLDVNFKSGDFSTPNQVVMNRSGGDITADRASGNYRTKDATLYGHVVMHDTQGNFAGLSSTAPAKGRGPATMTSDELQIDGAAKVYTAIGHVHYVQADTTVDADKGTLNDVTHDLYLEGNVHVVQGERNLTADHVLYNTITGDAHARGNVVMQFPSEVNPHFATPRPIKVPHLPFERTPKATPAPSSSASPG
jgi:lipopolysaccharide assembly outer membrane protein LptD (OstA)